MRRWLARTTSHPFAIQFIQLAFVLVLFAGVTSAVVVGDRNESSASRPTPSMQLMAAQMEAKAGECAKQFGEGAQPVYVHDGVRCVSLSDHGGLDLNAYCAAKYGPQFHASTEEHTVDQTDPADTWECNDSAEGRPTKEFHDVDYSEACQMQNSDPQFQSAPATPGGDSTWTCVKVVYLGGVDFHDYFNSAAAG